MGTPFFNRKQCSLFEVACAHTSISEHHIQDPKELSGIFSCKGIGKDEKECKLMKQILVVHVTCSAWGQAHHTSRHHPSIHSFNRVAERLSLAGQCCRGQGAQRGPEQAVEFRSACGGGRHIGRRFCKHT